MWSEPAIVAGLRNGEPAAFDQAYDRHRAGVYGYLLRLARRRDLAEDLFQETWLSLARSCRGLREDTDLRAWLFTVARNRYRSHRRWEMLDVSRWLVLGAPDVEPSDSVTPETLTEGARARRDVESALALLPERYREPLVLVGVEGMSHEQVAEILGIEPPALRKRLSRAREMLAGRLARRERARPGSPMLTKGEAR